MNKKPAPEASLERRFDIAYKGIQLRGFRDFSGLNTTGADFHSARAALWKLHSDRL